MMQPASQNPEDVLRLMAAPKIDPHVALTVPITAKPPQLPALPPSMSQASPPPVTTMAAPRVNSPASLPGQQARLEDHLMALQQKDDNPYGSPNNHPGMAGKLLHALSVVTGGPGRRAYQEQQLADQIQGLSKLESEEGLQAAQGQADTGNAEARLESAAAKANPTAKNAKPETWKPLLGGDGQILQTLPGKLIEVSSEGNLRQSDLPDSTTIAQKEAPDHSAFAAWSKNPQSFEAFQKFMHSFPSRSGHGGELTPWTAIEAMRTAYTLNPAMIPAAAQMAVQAFGEAGIHLTPRQALSLSGVPEGQPLSPETGNPIGTEMPEAPTAAIRTSAQGAQTLQAMIKQNILPALLEAQKEGAVGIGSGRVQDFLLRKIGDPNSAAAKLQATLDAVGPMLGRMYGYHSARYAQHFNGFLNTRMTPDALKGYLTGVLEHAKTAEEAQRGYGETRRSEAPIVQHSPSTGQYRYSTDGGRTWHPGQPKSQ